MKLVVKKVIAREILIIFIVLSLGIITYLVTCAINTYKWNKIEIQSSKIIKNMKLNDSLSVTYRAKIDKRTWFFNQFNNHYELSLDTAFDERDEIWKKFDKWSLNDSIHYKWEHDFVNENRNFFKSIGFPNSKILQSFFDKYRLNKIESSNYDSSLVIKSEIDILFKKNNEYESGIFSKNEQIDLTLNVLYVLFVLMFLIRYLFCLIKWSLKTLKQ
jgi:hypothetical protein